MEPFTCIEHFDFDDTAFAPTHSVDGMHAEPALTNQPRHYQLSHWLPLANAHAGTPRVRTVHFFCYTLNPTRLVPGARARVSILGRRRDRLVTVAEFAPFHIYSAACCSHLHTNCWRLKQFTEAHEQPAGRRN